VDGQFAGRRLLQLLEAQLRWLHHQPAHGNRVLCYDHLVIAHLVAFFNPTVDSLRTLEGAFAEPRVRQRFKLPRIARSTVADAQRLFDPQLLQPLVDDLRRRLKSGAHEPRLAALTRELLAVDATVFAVAGRIAWAQAHNPTSARGAVQVCLQFDVLEGAPAGFTLISGEESERAALPAAVRPGCLYLLDRAYQSYAHLKGIVAADSDFVVRLRHNANFEPLDVRPLTAADRLAGVQRDWQVRPSDPARQREFPPAARLVEIFTPGEAEPVWLLTNRLDLPAELIGVLYRHRWQIELFFRWLKCVAQLRHFTSESPTGMTLQIYVALIGTLLLALATGAPPSKYDYSLMSLAVSGWLTVEEALHSATQRRAERARAAAWQRAYNARNKISR
jgi:hypothetical protein